MSISQPFEVVGPARRWAVDLVVLLLALMTAMGAYTTGDAAEVLMQLMILLGIYGILLTLRTAVLLTIEAWRARRLVHSLEAGELGEALRAMHGRRGLLLGVVRGVYQQWASRSPKLETAPLIDAMELRLSEANNRARDIATTLLTIGLIGTIVGLMIMMTRMSGAMGANAEFGGPALIGRMFAEDGPMVGLGTAFQTTLAGSILGGLFLHVLAGSLQRSISRFVVHSDEWLTRRILPILGRATPTATDQSLQAEHHSCS